MSSQNDTPNSVKLTGSCLCGEVKLSSTALPLAVTLCHCIQCRKMSGSPFLSFGEYENDAVSWTGKTIDSEPPIKTKASHIQTLGVPLAQRAFCSNCGSPLWMKYPCDPQKTHIPLGIIDDDSVRGKLPKPKEHIFLKEKASWWELLDDGLGRCETFGEPWPEMTREWEENGCPRRNDVE